MTQLDPRLYEAFAEQARACAALGSAFTAQLMQLLPLLLVPGRLWDQLQALPGDLGPVGQSMPLRLAAGLHAVVLQNRDPELQALWPPYPGDEAALMLALRET